MVRGRSIPMAQRGILSRRRVEDLLDVADDYGVVLVCAPAGSGKSVMVTNWARRQRGRRPVAWLACSQLADTPTAFWSAAMAELASVTGGSADQPSPLHPNGSVPTARHQLLDSLLGWLETLPEGTVLVCDDFHEVGSSDTHRDLQYLINRLPLVLTVVIISRSYPPLAMHRARVEGRLLDIRADQLAFTRAETTDLLSMNGIELSDDELDLLHGRTEGWAAGLRLAMISLAHAEDATDLVRRLADSTDAVSGYLTEEVLAELDPMDREFLLQTCVADELTGPMVARLTGRSDGGQLLAEIAGRIGFLGETHESSGTYRYHPLFASLLRRQLYLTDACRFAGQHRLAALWYSDLGEPIRAVRHAQQANDWELAAQVAIAHVLPLAMRGRLEAIEQIIRRFPQDVAATDPRLLVVHAIGAVLQNEPDRAVELLARAEPGLDPGADPTSRRTRAVVGYVRGLIGRYRGDLAALSSAIDTDAPDVPGPDDTGFVHTDLDIHAAWSGARAAELLWADRISEAIGSAERARLFVQAGAGGWPLLTSLGVIAFGHALQGRLTAAGEAVDELARFVSVRDWSEVPYVAIVDFGSAWVAMERCEFESAEEALRRAERRHAQLRAGFTGASITILRARLALVGGDGPVAARNRLDALTEVAAASPLATRLAQQVRLEIALAEQDLETATRLSDGGSPLLSLYVDVRSQPSTDDELPGVSDDRGLLIRVLLARAIARHREGDLIGADRLLDRALDLAAAEGWRLPFRQLAFAVRPLLVDAQISAIRHGALIADLLTLTASDHGRGIELIDPLSPRELDVLRHLVAGQDTDEIADSLFVSRNTVRTHTKSIYRKLSVQSRRDAVRRAAALGII